MEYPRGHHHHHHRGRDDEEEREPYAPPPPGVNLAAAPPQPYHSEPYFAAPPPPGVQFAAAQPPSSYDPQTHYAAPPPPSFGQVSHVHHTSSEPYPPPDHRYGGYAAAPPPPNPYLESHGGGYAGVIHASHQHSHEPNMPSVSHLRHDENRLPENLAELAGRPTMKVYCKAEPNYYLTIRDGKIMLAPSDPGDEAQHWYKDEKYSTRVKDAEGRPCFALVNKATGEAIKHSAGDTQPVLLIPYDPDRLDESVLWTEGKDLGDGYCTIRMVNNIRLNMDAYHGDQRSGGVRDGTLVVLWSWNKGDNQCWRIVPF